MQRYERIDRMLRMINSGRAPSIFDFCREFEIKERQVRSDIQLLRDSLRLQIDFDSARGGYVNRDPKQQLPNFDLTEQELLSILVGAEMLTEYGGTVFEATLKSAIEKISKRLSERTLEGSEELSETVSVINNATAQSSQKVFTQLQKACVDKSPVHIVHFAPHSEAVTMRHVNPYRLVQNDGAWYLVGWCHKRQDMRTFAVHRISECRVMPGTFDIPADFNFDEWQKSAFKIEHGDGELEYVIHFDSKAAHYVRERNWHSTQKLENKEDGSCTLTFRATRMDEVKRWVLPYGAAAEVLQPEALRQDIANELRNAASRYAPAAKVVPIDASSGTKIAAREKKPAGPKMGTKPNGSGKRKEK